MLARQKQQLVAPGQHEIQGLSFPFQNSCQYADATYFNGVIAPYPIETFCCPLPPFFPAEFFVPPCASVNPQFSTTYNYRLLAVFSAFLQTIYNNSLSPYVNIPWVPDNQSVVVFAPSNTVWTLGTPPEAYIALGSVQKNIAAGTISGTGFNLQGHSVSFSNGVATDSTSTLTLTYVYLGQSRDGFFLAQALTLWSV
jgi:membrane-associated phospholipid phosphatase